MGVSPSTTSAWVRVVTDLKQTGKMGDGWAYVYNSDKIRGFKQTHRPSPWINDFGQFSLMPVTGGIRIDEDRRASWFSHKAEDARPYYYSVYLADYDVTTEFTPTDRCAYFQFTFPEGKDNYVIVDGYDRGSWIKVIPEENTIVGYSTRNSGGVTKNFRNYFVIKFDKTLRQQLGLGRKRTSARQNRAPRQPHRCGNRFQHSAQRESRRKSSHLFHQP